MAKVLIIGATSAIAAQAARLFAERKDSLYLFGRNEERLCALSQDLSLRGAAAVHHASFEFNDVSRHDEMIASSEEALGGLDIVLIAHGHLPDQAACERDFNLTLGELFTNAISVISFLTRLANKFEQRSCGTIAVISSVAGDRGRQSNYVYGAAKGMVSVFLQGLRNRLSAKGVHVLTIKPGFVDTPMTAHLKKGVLWAQPDAVAVRILKAIDRKENVVYVPWFWRYIMAVVCCVPESIFKRLKL